MFTRLPDRLFARAASSRTGPDSTGKCRSIEFPAISFELIVIHDAIEHRPFLVYALSEPLPAAPGYALSPVEYSLQPSNGLP